MLHTELQNKLRKLRELELHQPHDRALHRDLEDEIETLRANLNYIQDSITESQHNIVQVEESKVIKLNSQLVVKLVPMLLLISLI